MALPGIAGIALSILFLLAFLELRRRVGKWRHFGFPHSERVAGWLSQHDPND